MSDDPMFWVVIAACLAVLVVLAVGIGTFGRGGEANRKHANRLMRLRIIAQAIAIALVLLFIWLRSGG